MACLVFALFPPLASRPSHPPPSPHLSSRTLPLALDITHRESDFINNYLFSTLVGGISQRSFASRTTTRYWHFSVTRACFLRQRSRATITTNSTDESLSEASETSAEHKRSVRCSSLQKYTSSSRIHARARHIRLHATRVARCCRHCFTTRFAARDISSLAQRYHRTRIPVIWKFTSCTLLYARLITSSSHRVIS